MEDAEITKAIIGCAMKVHRSLGAGFLESVYQNALTHELLKSGCIVRQEWPICVSYDDIEVGHFQADMLVDERIIVENKAVRTLTIAHEVQLVNYLAATRTDVGLPLNFGAASLQFKRKCRLYQASSKSAGQD